MDGEQPRERVTGVGPALRACREKAGISLSDASRTLRIRQVFLAAIEDGRYADLPGHTYAIGFLRGYAEFLGLNSDEVIRRFRLEAADLEGASELHFPSAPPESGVPRGGILLVGVLIVVVAYGAWYLTTSRNDFVADVVDPLPDRLASLLSPSRTNDAANEAPAVPTPPAHEKETASAVQPVERAPASSEPHTASSAIANASAAEGEHQNATVEANSVLPAAADPEPGPAQETVERNSEANAAAVNDAPEAPAARMNSQQPLQGLATVAADAQTTAPPPATAIAADRAGNDVSAPPGNPSAPPAGAAGEASDITLRATEASWIEIEDRYGKRVASRLLEPGETYQVRSGVGMRMTVGNAGGLEVIVNGETLPRLGDSGVVRRDVQLDVKALREPAAAVN